MIFFDITRLPTDLVACIFTFLPQSSWTQLAQASKQLRAVSRQPGASLVAVTTDTMLPEHMYQMRPRHLVYTYNRRNHSGCCGVNVSMELSRLLHEFGQHLLSLACSDASVFTIRSARMLMPRLTSLNMGNWVFHAGKSFWNELNSATPADMSLTISQIQINYGFPPDKATVSDLFTSLTALEVVPYASLGRYPQAEDVRASSRIVDRWQHSLERLYYRNFSVTTDVPQMSRLTHIGLTDKIMLQWLCISATIETIVINDTSPANLLVLCKSKRLKHLTVG